MKTSQDNVASNQPLRYKSSKKCSELKIVFEERPIVTYRRPKSLSSYLVKDRYIPNKTKIACHKDNGNQKQWLLTNVWIHSRRKSSRQSVVHVAECTKHKLRYIRQTGDQLNDHFTRHRSDIKFYPDHCELSKRFHSNGCNFEEDLIIPILEKLKDSVTKEDHWIMQSNISDPNGWRKLFNLITFILITLSQEVYQ